MIEWQVGINCCCCLTSKKPCQYDYIRTNDSFCKVLGSKETVNIVL